MLKQLSAVFAPLAALGAIGTGAYFGLGGTLAWMFIWTSLVAVAFLCLAVVAFLFRWRWFIPPLLAAFAGQILGIIVLARNRDMSPWQTLLYCAVTLGICLFVMLVIWIVALIRARLMQDKLLSGAGTAAGDPQTVAEIRRSTVEAIRKLEKEKGRGAVYFLPWTLVVGRPQVGKTFAIQNSGFRLLTKDWSKGLGGTLNADWFLTPEMIFVDTPGKWTQEVMEESDRANWRALLALLRKYRPARPLDAIVVVVSADDLLLKGAKDLREQAGRIREVYDLLHDELKFRFPVYVLVSKCDLVEGFVEFFEKIPAQRRQEVLGWSNADANAADAASIVSKAFRRVVRRLEAYRLEYLSRGGFSRKLRRLFMFPDEFRRMEEGLIAVTDVLFEDDGTRQPPVFRGVYFTSSTQGEGFPLANALGDIARVLGVRLAPEQEVEEKREPKSYFLRELFGEIIAGDEGLVGRSARHWWDRRKNTALFAALPAAVAAGVLLLAITLLLMNGGLYRRVADEVPKVVRALDGIDGPDLGQNVSRALAETEKLRALHSQMTGFSPRGLLFMRQPGLLATKTFDIFRREFEENVLGPTLDAAYEFAGTGDPSKCPDRIGIMHSVVWLRLGRRVQSSDELAPLTKVWGLTDKTSERLADDVLLQFGYLTDELSTSDRLLKDFHLDKVAETIRRDCRAVAKGSALASYLDLQSACGNPIDATATRECFTKLSDLAKLKERDYEEVRSRLEGMRYDLEELATLEDEASRAKQILDEIELPEVESGKCLKNFGQNAVPAIQEFIGIDQELDACKLAAAGAGPAGGAREVVVGQSLQQLQGKQDAGFEKLKAQFTSFNTTCGSEGRLDPNAVKTITTRYFRVACLGEITPFVAIPPPVVPERVAKKKPASGGGGPPPAPVTGPGWTHLRATQALPAPAATWFQKVQDAKTQYSQLAYDPALQQSRLVALQGELATLEQSYRNGWIGFLRGLQLKPSTLTPATLLRQLAISSDFRDALGRAAEGLNAAANAPPVAPFESAGMTLKDASLRTFVDSGLAQYQQLLDRIGRDLEQCSQDGQFLKVYKQQLQNNDASIALGQAEQFVGMQAALAGGAMQPLLRAPLAIARDAILGGDPFPLSWQQLVAGFQALENTFPFKPGSEEPAPEDVLAAVFGEKNGAVTRAAGNVQGRLLRPDARDWLKDAEALSAVFFKPNTDQLRPLKVQLQLESAAIEPAKSADDYRIDKVVVQLGDDQVELTPTEKATKSGLVTLFGEEGNRSAQIRVLASEQEGMLKKKWTPLTEKIVFQADDQPWAAVRMLADAARSPAKQLQLQTDLTPKVKAKVTLRLVNPAEVAALAKLLEGGFGPPPGQAE